MRGFLTVICLSAISKDEDLRRHSLIIVGTALIKLARMGRRALVMPGVGQSQGDARDVQAE
ncbi:hypothetical protein AUC60_02485 [Pseudomonas caspiana]|uniref:Uncharacterized protein n=1 Tax=Pseudomonas caspiana TaxID=1451454 RepID=A0A1Y3P992_9PSED|nr:hypothetical protein AUC60_02485 [Pseudomonas caspiana]